LPDHDLFVDVSDILFAGHETTAYTLNFACHALSWYPEWQEKVQQECDDFPSPTPTYEDSQKMKILLAVVKETLRMFPIAPGTARKAINNTKIGNIIVPAGVIKFHS
jgi:cytochrome P450